MRPVLLVLAVLLISPLATADSRAVTVTGNAIVLRQPIYFESTKPVIKSESHAILDAVAATLKTNQKIALVEIQGHTDARGNDEWNLKVSALRAQAVYKYLVDRGVEPGRLRAKGYGETKPLDRRANAKAWQKNRRIAFVILQRVTT